MAVIEVKKLSKRFIIKEKEKGIKNAVLTSDKDNPASWKTMERLGGKLEEEFETDDGIIEKRYTINVDESLEENKDKYEKYVME